MKWLTKKQINAAAKKSLRAAWRMSIEHWIQMCSVDEEEYDKASVHGRVSMSDVHCALCVRVKLGLGKCPFNKECDKDTLECFPEFHATLWNFGNRHMVLKKLVVAYNKKYGTKLRSKV